MPTPIVGRAGKVFGRRPSGNTGPDPTTGVFGGGAGEMFQDFKSDYSMGSGSPPDRTVSHLWGDSGAAEHRPSGIGTVMMHGSGAGVGLMTFPLGANACFPNGMFEFRAKFSSSTGNIGSGSGPALVIWPGDDIWPGSEVDLGEINWEGDAYTATHWRDDVVCADRGGDCYRTFLFKDPPGNITDKYFLDRLAHLRRLSPERPHPLLPRRRLIGEDTENPAVDFAGGGVNHAFGFMNRSPETTCECDWMRWTPEATMEAKLGNPNPPPPPPSQSVDLPGPGGGTPGRFHMQFTGQSNAGLFYNNDNYSTSSLFYGMLNNLTLLGDDLGMSGELNQSMFGGTGTFKLYNNNWCWMQGEGRNWNDATTWRNNYEMSDLPELGRIGCVRHPVGTSYRADQDAHRKRHAALAGAGRDGRVREGVARVHPEVAPSPGPQRGEHAGVPGPGALRLRQQRRADGDADGLAQHVPGHVAELLHGRRVHPRRGARRR